MGASAEESVLAPIVQRAFDRGVTPGMAVAVVQDGAIVFERGYGTADLATMRGVTAETPFAVGSLTKQFTAVATLQLAHAGKLRLDDTLAATLPVLPNAATITVRDLLQQTSGLHNYPNTNEHPWPLSGPIAPSALFALMAKDPSDFAPGTRWAYSNANYAALAAIVARAAGTSYEAYLREAVFAPLGMRASGYGYAAQTMLPVATAYAGKPAAPYPQTLSLDLYSGAGGIVASAHDVALWTRALIGPTFLDARSKASLWSAGSLADGSATPYAMGFVPSRVAGKRAVWHNGFAPFAGGYCYDELLPDDGIAVVILTNGDLGTVGSMPESTAREIVATLLAAKP